MTIRGIGRLRASSRYDPAAMDWYSRVLTAGGTANATTIAAVSKFAASCRLAGIWTKLNRVNLFCGSQLTAALVPLKVGAGNATDTNVNFVSGDYTEATGITGNGSSKYLNTGLNPISASFSSSSIGLHSYVQGTEAGGTSRTMIGANTAANNLTALGWLSAGTTEVGALGTASSAEYAPGAGAAAKQGFLSIVANGSRSQQYYQNGAAVGSAVAATGVLPSLALFVCALNNNGTPAQYSTRAHRAYAVSTGMSASEISSFNTIMETFQDALSRGVQ